MAKKVWMYHPTPKKLKDTEKLLLQNKVREFIQTSEKLSKTINRLEIRAGRLYLYNLVEQFGWNDPDITFIVPLIEGKYMEFTYARITVLTNEKFRLDWQRHNGKWMELCEDTLDVCLKHIDEQNDFFN